MPAQVDNGDLIAQYIDEKPDGDTFWYTELLDRNIKGSSRFKLLRTFEHDSRAHFLEKLPAIQELCVNNGVRAYTRLSPRSRKQVAKALLEKLFKQVVLDGVYDQTRRAYASVCGKNPIHDRKLWLFDVDYATSVDPMRTLAFRLEMITQENGSFVGKIPTKNGLHIICKPHHVTYDHTGVELHKDNPTVLYVPAGAK